MVAKPLLPRTSKSRTVSASEAVHTCEESSARIPAATRSWTRRGSNNELEGLFHVNKVQNCALFKLYDIECGEKR